FEEYMCDDAEYRIVAFGLCSRICQKGIEEGRKEGIKVGLLRPVTLWPFPTKEIQRLAKQVKGILTVEMNDGQMIEDVRLAVNGTVPVNFYGRQGGIIPSPDEALEALRKMMK
ncbi:MAG: 3-methyl-2-oxobutanoate dehydrogenase subunit beta, partial [Paludibacteraceae bacterium]|nr:3-methyl-2-oxobutanoate dehydrogenase subunit beta [Paludibacteraceae bacterium]